MSKGAQPSSVLLQKLSKASKAAIDFTEACRRVFNVDRRLAGHNPPPELTERDLKTWREASEALKVALGAQEGVFFFPYAPFEGSDASYTRQVNIINLGVILEMFLPDELRLKYPNWTNRIPLIDPEYGSSQEYTLQEKIKLLEIPLNQLRVVFLRICAGMTGSRIQLGIRQILLELSLMTHFVISKALGKQPFKTVDIMRYFNTAFLRDPSLIPSVFGDENKRFKAEKMWEEDRAERLKRIEVNPANSAQYCWRDTSRRVMEKTCRLAVTHACGHARKELDELKAKTSDARKPRDTATAQKKELVTKGDSTHLDAAKAHPLASLSEEPIVTPRNPGSTPPPPSSPAPVRTLKALPSSLLEPPLENVRMVSKQAKMASRVESHTNAQPVAGTSKSATGYPSGLTRTKQIASREEPPSLLPDDDAGGLEGESMDIPTDLVNIPEDNAPSPYDPVTSAPAFVPLGQPRAIPKGFVFNAPQVNAQRITMTPSPTSSPVATPAPDEPRQAQHNSKSMLQKLKKNIPLDRNRSRTISTGTNKAKEVSMGSSREREMPTGSKHNQDATVKRAAVSPSKEKRKRQINEEVASDEDEDEEAESRTAKKRKVESGMPPPSVIPSKKNTDAVAKKHTDATGRNPRDSLLSRPSGSSTVTLVQSPSSAASAKQKAKETLSTTVQKPSEVVPPKPKRRPLVLADTSSDESDGGNTRARRMRRAMKAAEINTSPPASMAASPPTHKQPTVASTSKTASRRDETQSVSQSDMEAMARRLGIEAGKTASARERIAAIRADQEAAKRRALAAASGEKDEEEVDSEEEWRRRKAASLQRVVEADSEDELQRSKAKVKELQRRAQAPPPVLKRAKHLPVLSEDEEEEEEEEAEAGAGSKKKRGRPRKVHRSESPEQEMPKQIYRYATGGNETGRVRWTKEEDEVLLFAIEALYYKGDRVKPWDLIHRQHGPNGTEDRLLARRNVQQLKDRARNIAIKYASNNGPVPEYLRWIKIPSKYT
ncbi:hypothetical protein FRB91_009112 [Serendipita sp. 411]|nr:hypothetical protein FRB91_009112 [Serendipita sp. 411]